MITTSATETITKGLTVTILSECTNILYDLRWMVLLAIVLILADFWFGVSASKMKHIEVRKSRAGRRTINKLIDYICYVLIGVTIGKAIGEPYGFNPHIVAVSIMVLCYCFEIDSIYGHICTLHGIKKNFSIWKIFWLLITFKFKSVGEAFKDLNPNSEHNKNQNENV